MRAIWSLRSPVGSSSGWADERHHLLAWVLSVMKAREHYGATALVTDARGRAVLAGALELPFDAVSTALDDAPPATPARLHAYQLQAEPFVHLDPDVFLWQPLSPAVSRAPVFAQNPIPAPAGGSLRPVELDNLLEQRGAWRPAAWRWALENGLVMAADTSLVGANYTSFMRRFAAEAIRFFEDEAGAPIWRLAQPAETGPALERFLLAAFVAYYRRQTEAGWALDIAYLFASPDAAQTTARAEAIGYTRLGPAGRADRDLALRLERRVAREYPEYYRRCLRLLAAWRGW